MQEPSEQGAKGRWPPAATYLELPSVVAWCAETAWASLHPHCVTVGCKSAAEPDKEPRNHQSPLERSVCTFLQELLIVPLANEAVLPGTRVPVDLAIVAARGLGHGSADACLAIEIQGPHHFVSNRCIRETRSSAVKRRLRQCAGWTVVNVEYKDWKRASGVQRRDLLRELLADLPDWAWGPDAEGDAICVEDSGAVEQL